MSTSVEEKAQFIGPRKIKSIRQTDEKTTGDIPLFEVTFEDGVVERFSELMFKKIVSEESCDLNVLRDKRVFAVVEVMLEILRDWGIRLSELPYLSAVLNRSLDTNTKEALSELWSHWMPKPQDPEDVDLITIDRILKSKKVTLADVLGNQDKKPGK